MKRYIQVLLSIAAICSSFCATPSQSEEGAPAQGDLSQVASSVSDAPSEKVVMEKLAKSPAVFIENRGQWEDETIRYALSGMGANVGLASEGLRFQLFRRQADPQAAPDTVQDAEAGSGPDTQGERPGENRGDGLRRRARGENRPTPAPVRGLEFSTRFVGARRVLPKGEALSEQVFHYRRGEASRWRENVPSFEGIVYPNLYDGIDLRVTGKRTGVKYEFLVAPGADWRQIRLSYEGVERLTVREDGALEIHPRADWPPLQDASPLLYQEIKGVRQPVAGRYALDGTVCGFEITGGYDPSRPLVIDPDLEWSTYLGGSDNDGNNWGGVALDGSGNILVTGETWSSGWVSGGFDTTWGGYNDAFVTKLSSSGGHLWSTYLGGNGFDEGYGVAVDGSGNIVVAGSTSSSGWVSGGFDTTYNGGLYDGFVAKLSSSGGHLWSTCLGGSNDDWGWGVAVDGSGNIVVTGRTWSSEWVSGGFDTTFDFFDDAFVAKLSSSGDHLWSTYLGGSGWTEGYGVAVEGSGNILVTGGTNSSGWVSGGFDTTLGGYVDAFVAKLSSSGGHLWSTYLGGSDDDWGNGVAVDGSGNIVVTGVTESSGYETHGGYRDAFVAKLSSSGGLLWSTYLGGSGGDGGYGVAVDGSGNIVVTGDTTSSGWVSGGFDTILDGDSDAFVAKLSASGGHLWSTYLGGNIDDWGWGVAVDGSGNILVTGGTSSNGWVSGGFDTTFNDVYDAFVAKIRDRSPQTGVSEWVRY